MSKQLNAPSDSPAHPIVWTLTRFAYLPLGTLGRLTRPEGAQTMYTIEKPWRNNAPYESCVPEGNYSLVPFHGNRWEDVIQLADVPGRTSILIHPGNQPDDLSGCIAPGMNWLITSGGVPKVTESRVAFEAIMEDFRKIFDSPIDFHLILHITSANARLTTGREGDNVIIDNLL